jgi:myo-inositol-1(or 4)-monophosphatase
LTGHGIRSDLAQLCKIGLACDIMSFDRDAIHDRHAFAIDLARRAGALALDFFERRDALVVETKESSQDLVSRADREVELLIRAAVAGAFPQDGLLGEEYGREDGRSGFTWVIDPIDGTAAFLHGIRSWTVSIGLTAGEEIVAGVVHDPCADELFEAVAGGGARLNGKAIAVAAAAGLGDGLIGFGINLKVPPSVGAGFLERLLLDGGAFLRLGSAAQMLAHVAAGRLIAFYEPVLSRWDCYAGFCLIREAGGWVDDVFWRDGGMPGGLALGGAPGVRTALTKIVDFGPAAEPRRATA